MPWREFSAGIPTSKRAVWKISIGSSLRALVAAPRCLSSSTVPSHSPGVLPGKQFLCRLLCSAKFRITAPLFPSSGTLKWRRSLALKHRDGLLTNRDLHNALALFRLLRIVTEEQTRCPNVESLLSLTRGIRLSAYDATYIDLALRTGLPFATFDKAMTEAARENHVQTAVA